MQSFRKPSRHELPELSVTIPLPADLTISLSTVPLLGLIAAGQLVHHSITELGKASEEVFRGDRLPTRPLLSEDA